MRIELDQINFFCLGAQKSGTSTLFQLLRQHPEVFMPLNKEAHFFDKDELFKNGLEWYLKKSFHKYDNQKIAGTITPSYLYSEKVPARLSESFGNDLKLIVILRNPAERAWSNYLMSKSSGRESYTFKEALSRESDRILISEHNKIHYSYISRGFYSKQLKRYYKYFDPSNFLILSFEEDIIQNPQRMMAKVCTFLNIEQFNFDFSVEKNQFKSRRSFFERAIRKINRFGKKAGIIEGQFGEVNKVFQNKEHKPKLDKAIKLDLMENIFKEDITELSILLNTDFKKKWS